jgi:hypothetical protein
VTFVANHSSAANRLDCPKAAFYPICSSRIASWRIFYNPVSAAFSSTLGTPSAEFAFSFGTVGTLDGAPITIDKIESYGTSYVSEVGLGDTLANFQNLNLNSEFRTPKSPLQYLTLLLTFRLAAFSHEMFYDPDASLKLLFDYTEPPTATQNAASIDGLTGEQVGIIAGVTVTVVVLVAATVSFLHTSFFAIPFLLKLFLHSFGSWFPGWCRYYHEETR